MILRELQWARKATKSTELIISHNHPSGDPTPSFQDRQITQILERSLKKIGLNLKDHIITNGESFCSYQLGWKLQNLKMPKPQWELVRRNNLTSITKPKNLIPIVTSLKQVNPNCDHLIYLNTRLKIVAIERIPNSLRQTQMFEAIASGAGREGANNILIVSDCFRQNRCLLTPLQENLSHLGVNITDVCSSNHLSYKEAGILNDICKDNKHSPSQSF